MRERGALREAGPSALAEASCAAAAPGPCWRQRGLTWALTLRSFPAPRRRAPAGLTLQLLIAPDSLAEDDKGPRPERLPSVSLTDDIFSVRRAFQEAEEMGRRESARAEKEAARQARQQQKGGKE